MFYSETSPLETYFGSYTDDYITGSMVTKTTINGTTTIVTGARGKIASSIAGGNLLGNISQVGPYLRYSYLSQSQFVRSQRFVQLVSADRQYHDSFLPEMSQIFDADGVFPVLIRDYNPSTARFIYAYLFGTVAVSGSIFGGVSYTMAVTSSEQPGVKLSNSDWISSFPYQGKYRDVERRKFPAQLSSLKFRGSASFADASTLSTVLIAGTSSVPIQADASLRVVSGDNFWVNTGTGTFLSPQAYPAPVFLVSGNIDSRIEEPSWGVTSFSQSMVLVGSDFTGVTSIAGAISAPTFNSLVGPDFTDTVKFFFGVGSLPNKVPDYSQVGWFVKGGPVRYVAGPRIRGWKYGIMNGIPAYEKYIFMRNKFGQVRHMLEQPKVSKVVDLKSGTVYPSPVRITFISSSISWENSEYITASNPSLNTRDCGYYDFEGKVGQPFSAS